MTLLELFLLCYSVTITIVVIFAFYIISETRIKLNKANEELEDLYRNEFI